MTRGPSVSTLEKQLAAIREKEKALKQKLKETKRPKGCVRFDEKTNRWSFTWREEGKQKCKYFSVGKLGEEEAKKAAEAYRFVIFPDSPRK